MHTSCPTRGQCGHLYLSAYLQTDGSSLKDTHQLGTRESGDRGGRVTACGAPWWPLELRTTLTCVRAGPGEAWSGTGALTCTPAPAGSIRVEELDTWQAPCETLLKVCEEEQEEKQENRIAWENLAKSTHWVGMVC